MDKKGRRGVVMLGICAVVWTVRIVFDIAYGRYMDSAFSFALNALCAILWYISFFVQLKRCRSGGEE